MMEVIYEGFISTLLILLYLNRSLVEAQQCSSTNRTIYLKSANGDLRSAGYDTQNGITLDQCSKKCSDELTKCNSFTYNKGGQTCLLRAESAQPYGNGVLTGIQQSETAFYQKICIQSDRICNIVGVFDWYPQYVLVGFSMEVLRASSTSECLQLCLEFGAVNKICKSTMYFYDTKECVINSESRSSRPALFGNDTQGFVVDYFDNNCATNGPVERPSTPITCTAPAVPRYTLVKDQQLRESGKKDRSQQEYVVKSQNVDESVCRTLCDNNKNEFDEPVRCRGYSYDTVSKICYLSSDLTSPRGESTFVDRRSFNYYEKVCLAYANHCPQPTFTRYPDHVLVGYAREVYRFSMVADCLDACLNSRTVMGFDCLSVMYYYETGECVVNSATKDDQPALFSGDTQALEADYFENNCVHNRAGYGPPTYEPTNAPYQPPPLITAPRPPYEPPREPSIGVAYSTLPAPPPPPESPSPFVPIPAPPPPTEPSRSVILPPAIPGEQAHPAQPPPPPPHEPALDSGDSVNRQTTTFFEPTHVFIFPASDANANPNIRSSSSSSSSSSSDKLGVSSECLLDSVRITIVFPQPTSGAVFLKHQFSTCRKVFARSTATVFDIPLRGPSPPGALAEPLPVTVQPKLSTIQRCEAVLIGINKYSWVIVVQQNEIDVPSLMTAEDQIFNVTCDYSEAFTKILPEAATFLPVGRLPATELDSKQIPRPDAKISMELLRDGVPVTMVLLGEELELRWRIDSTTPNVAFFVHDCLAERVGGLPPEPSPLRLITDGCPDPSISGRIMTSPVIQLSAGLSTRMTMFRFDGSRSVKIKCAIDMCVLKCRPVKCLVKGQEFDSLGRRKRNSLEAIRTPSQLLPGNTSDNLRKNNVQQRQFETAQDPNNFQSTIVGIFTIVDQLPHKDDRVKTVESGEKAFADKNDNDNGKSWPVVKENGLVCLMKPVFVFLFTFLSILCFVEGVVVAKCCWTKYKNARKSIGQSPRNSAEGRQSAADSVRSDESLISNGVADNDLRRRVFGVHRLRKNHSLANGSPIGWTTGDDAIAADDSLEKRQPARGSPANSAAGKIDPVDKARRPSDYVDTTLEAVRSLSIKESSVDRCVGAAVNIKQKKVSKSKTATATTTGLVTANGSPVDSEAGSCGSLDFPTYLAAKAVVKDIDDMLNSHDRPPEELAPSAPVKPRPTTTPPSDGNNNKRSKNSTLPLLSPYYPAEYRNSDLIKTVFDDIDRRRRVTTTRKHS